MARSRRDLGARRRFDWNFGRCGSRPTTSQPNSPFEQTAAAPPGRAPRRPPAAPRCRGDAADRGHAGQTAFGRPDLDALFRPRPGCVSPRRRAPLGRPVPARLILGYARTDHPRSTPRIPAPTCRASATAGAAVRVLRLPEPAGFRNDTSRLSPGYQLEAQAGSRHLVTAGGDLEHECGHLGSRGERARPTARTSAPTCRTGWSGRPRLPHRGRPGRTQRQLRDESGPRRRVAWRDSRRRGCTTLRASAGAGIKEPSFLESFGVSFYAAGEPRPESRSGAGPTTPASNSAFSTAGCAPEAMALPSRVPRPDRLPGLDFDNLPGHLREPGRKPRAGDRGRASTPRPRRACAGARNTRSRRRGGDEHDRLRPRLCGGRGAAAPPRHQGSLTAHYRRGALRGGRVAVPRGLEGRQRLLRLGLTENDGYARLDARLQVRVVRGLEAFWPGRTSSTRVPGSARLPRPRRAVRAGLRFRTGLP